LGGGFFAVDVICDLFSGVAIVYGGIVTINIGLLHAAALD